MIKKYTTKNGETRYLFQTYLGIDPVTGKERRTTRRGFKTIKEAKQAERNLLLDVEENGLPSSNGNFSNPTFEEIALLWLESYKTTVKSSTYSLTEIKLKKIIKDHFEKMKIKKISVPYCQKVVVALSEKYILYTNYLSIIHRVFRYAVLIDIIPANPLDKVIKPKSKPISKRDNYLSKDELKALLEITRDASLTYFGPLVHLLSYTGLREGEALALKWSDIDFENKQLSVTKTATRNHWKQIIQTPKTKNSIRTISIDDATLSVLKKWRKDQIKIYFRNGKHFEGDDNFVFTNENADWVDAQNFTRYFKKTLKRHGMKVITPHGLRHTHASLLFAAGVEPKNISDRLGHSTIKITLDLYTHIADEQRTDAIDKLVEYMIL